MTARRWARLTADPGRIRLREASVATASVLVAAAGSGLLARWLHVDDGQVLMSTSAFLALQASIADKSDDRRQWWLTVVWLLVPAVVVAGIYPVAHLSVPVANAGVVVVVGLAVWLRRFGPVAGACGRYGFFAYLFIVVMHGGHRDDYRLIWVAPMVAVVAVALVGTAVPNRPLAVLRRLTAQWRRELNAVDADHMAQVSRMSDALGLAYARRAGVECRWRDGGHQFWTTWFAAHGTAVGRLTGVRPPTPPATTVAEDAVVVARARAAVTPVSSRNRAVVQAVVATAIAAAVGQSVSEPRWYWAVLTAFLVFSGTTDVRGEVLTRAWRRTLGTIFGAVTAIGLILVVGGSPLAQIVLLALAVFGTTYMGQTSYIASTYCATIIVVTLYELIGVYDMTDLTWRVNETVAGAAVGLVAAYVIPAPDTPTVLRSQLRDFRWALTDFTNSVTTARAAVVEEPTADDRLIVQLGEVMLRQRQLRQTVVAAQAALRPEHRARARHDLDVVILQTDAAFAQFAAAEAPANADSAGTGRESGRLQRLLDGIEDELELAANRKVRMR